MVVLPAAVLSGPSWMRESGHGSTLVPQRLTSISNQLDVSLRLPRDALRVPSGTKSFKRHLLHAGVGSPAHTPACHLAACHCCSTQGLRCFSAAFLLKRLVCRTATELAFQHPADFAGKARQGLQTRFSGFIQVIEYQCNTCYLGCPIIGTA